MKTRQLAALFVCNLMPFVVGNAFLGLLPIYARQLGANEIVAGIYLAFAFGTLAFATLIGGWLSDRFQRRKQMIILSGLLGLPATFLMGQVDSLVLLTIFTMIVWFAGGVTTAMVNILTGMYADARTRGRTFGIIGLTLGLGQIIGGAVSGAIVERWGYPALFGLVSLVWIISSVAGLFLEDARQSGNRQNEADAPAQPTMSRAIWWLIIAHIVASITSFTVGLGRPLLMDGLGFEAAAITSAITVNGFIALPLPLLIGWLSDRVGRSRLLMVSYLAVALGSLTLMSAVSIAQIWISTAIFGLGGAAVSLGFAYVTDLSTPESLAAAMSRFSATPWIAGVLGYGLAGFVIQSLGLQSTFLLTAALPLLSILMLVAISRQPRPAQSPTIS